MRRAQVLLSTFNGERYLPELLDSLLTQTYPCVSILVRDDGSRDDTPAILERYAAQGRLVWYAGGHMGVGASFFDLLSSADPHADCFAFCDQDDVWLPGKVERLAGFLEKPSNGEAVLYCGRAVIVDEALTPIGATGARRKPSLGNALVENIAPGCTMALNASARTILLRHARYSEALHDAWSYLVISALGRVIYDNQPMVLYRQHAGNAIGARRPRWRWRLRRLATLGRDGHLRPFVAQATEFLRLYGDELTEESRRTIDGFLKYRRSVPGAVRYALAGDVYRQTRIDNLILKTLIALRRL